MDETHQDNGEQIDTLSNEDDIRQLLIDKKPFGGKRIANVTFHGEFNFDVDFYGAIFGEGVSFSGVEFKGNTANFRGVQFESDIYFKKACFKYEPRFQRTTFKGTSEFSECIFVRGADFSEAHFVGEAVFEEATFQDHADFKNTKFDKQADFRSTKFIGVSNEESPPFIFTDALFYHNTVFSRAEFKGNVQFMSVQFNVLSRFDKIQFSDKADFSKACFNDEVNFEETKFDKKAIFEDVQFRTEDKHTSFSEAEFNDEANFKNAQFKDKVYFEQTKFNNEALFNNAQFGNKVVFEGGKSNHGDTVTVFFREYDKKKEFPNTYKRKTDFSNTYFVRPKLVMFKQVYLGRTILNDTDISEIDFTDVEWANKKDLKKHKNGFINKFTKERDILWDEVEAYNGKSSCPLNDNSLCPLNNNSYSPLVEKQYRQLKLNFENRGDYAGAGDFHWGEMEMRRLKHNNWFRRNIFSLTPWYKYLSGYGQWASVAFIWLLIFIFAPPLIYLLSGMVDLEGNTEFLYFFKLSSWSNLLSLKFRHDYWESLLYGLETLTLFRNPGCSPKDWGRGVAVLQKIFGLVQMAFLALTLKRKFKR